jgi:two-component system chemotaxis response regulator CheB
MQPAAKPIRVLVVDDSALMRQLLTGLLADDPEIEVVGAARDPLVARDMIKTLNPDVVTLDVEMPNMDGLAFLRKIMTLRPMPVVMISTLTQAGAEVTLEALEIGAVDFVGKPTKSLATALDEIALEIQTKVKAAARCRVTTPRALRRASDAAPLRQSGSGDHIIAVGASTGGVEALKALLMDMPANCPPILIAQHMPARFTSSFAERLDRECPMHVHEAAHNQPVEPGNVYIAPGSYHLELARSGTQYRCRLSEGELVSGHRPSVDVLFRSFAQTVGRRGVGAILTGMGKDGANGLLEMRQAGASTFGQDEATSLIYGMPRAAFERGAVMRQEPLSHMADAILEACGWERASQERPTRTSQAG